VAYAALNYKSAILRAGEVVEIKELGRRNYYTDRTHEVRVKGGHDGARRWFSNDNLIKAPEEEKTNG
jgi:hypothetical protein